MRRNSKDKKELLVIELKKGKASDAVVGQIQRYMGYINSEFLEEGQVVKGAIIALEDDLRIKRALSVTKDIDFYINENKVKAASIEQELKLLIKNEKEPAIILHTDKTVAIEHVVKVMDIAYRNKYKIVLATTPN